MACFELLHSPWKWKILGLMLYFIIYLKNNIDRHSLTFLYITFMYKRRGVYSELVNVICSRPCRNVTYFCSVIELEELCWWLSCKESTCNAGDIGSIFGSGRSLPQGNGNPLQYSCQGNLMDRGAWQATVHGGAKSRSQLSS